MNEDTSVMSNEGEQAHNKFSFHFDVNSGLTHFRCFLYKGLH